MDNNNAKLNLHAEQICFGKLRDGAKVPSFGRFGDGCMDIYACFEEDTMKIEPHQVRLIPTGICSTFSHRYRISIRERGSNTKGTAIIMAGQIDSNYTGEWFVAVYNGNSRPLYISKKVREVTQTDECVVIPYDKAIAQCAVEQIPDIRVVEVPVDAIAALKTNRGDGKLGSSGK